MVLFTLMVPRLALIGRNFDVSQKALVEDHSQEYKSSIKLITSLLHLSIPSRNIITPPCYGHHLPAPGFLTAEQPALQDLHAPLREPRLGSYK